MIRSLDSKTDNWAALMEQLEAHEQNVFFLGSSAVTTAVGPTGNDATKESRSRLLAEIINFSLRNK